MIIQKELILNNYGRGYHLITDLIERELGDLPSEGILNIFIKHSSAGITINENADPTVRKDFESYLNHMIPEDDFLYTHVTEGSDDMPAHIKSSVIGASLSIPITKHRLNLGIWQGVYFCEFRNQGGSRRIVLTMYY